MKLFNFDIHIGKWRVLVQTRDIADKAITGSKILDRVIDWFHIKKNAIRNEHINDKSVNNRTLGDGSVDGRVLSDLSVGTSKLEDDAVTDLKLAGNAVRTRNIKDRNVTTPKIDNAAVTTDKLKDQSVTPDKISEDFKAKVVEPYVTSLDRKYTDITNELYSMVESVQQGGVALSQQFGDRTDIGISQKTLTKALGAFWDEMSTITHKTYMDFTLTVVPATAFTESATTISITADCTGSISNFDSIRIYMDDVLVAESNDIEVFTISQEISRTVTIKAVGVVLGKTITKTQQVLKDIPFFMGSALSDYHDVMTIENHRDIQGSTIEGDYDLVVKHDGEHMFIIIPATFSGQFRRANMKVPDMNGFEIPLDLIEQTDDYVVYKSSAVSGYYAATYNIDIDVDS